MHVTFNIFFERWFLRSPDKLPDPPPAHPPDKIDTEANTTRTHMEHSGISLFVLN